MGKLENKEMERFYEAVLTLQTVEECEAFFEDICTIREVMDMSLRLRVAALLNSGKAYQEISKETGASTATICRVNRCLVYGDGGYRTVLERMTHRTEAKTGGTENDVCG
ncbi:MAG: YerC/YecD family TrpR-related protein [Faecousia sp.]